MDVSMAAVMITAATAVLVVKILSSTPARIAATLTAIAVLFAVIPRIVGPLTPPPVVNTETVAPREPATTPSTHPSTSALTNTEGAS